MTAADQMMSEAGGMKADPAALPAFDMLDQAIQQRPFDAYSDLRDRAAVEVVDPTASPLTYVGSHYDSVRAVLRDPGTFSSRVWPHPVMLFLGPAADPCVVAFPGPRHRPPGMSGSLAIAADVLGCRRVDRVDPVRGLGRRRER
jgi:cytochrome P450